MSRLRRYGRPDKAKGPGASHLRPLQRHIHLEREGSVQGCSDGNWQVDQVASLRVPQAPGAATVDLTSGSGRGSGSSCGRSPGASRGTTRARYASPERWASRCARCRGTSASPSRPGCSPCGTTLGSAAEETSHKTSQYLITELIVDGDKLPASDEDKLSGNDTGALRNPCISKKDTPCPELRAEHSVSLRPPAGPQPNLPGAPWESSPPARLSLPPTAQYIRRRPRAKDPDASRRLVNYFLDQWESVLRRSTEHSPRFVPSTPSVRPWGTSAAHSSPPRPGGSTASTRCSV